MPGGGETNDCDEDPAVAANGLATSRRGDGGSSKEWEAKQGLSRPGIMTGHVESGASTRAVDSAAALADKALADKALADEARSGRLSSAVDGSSAKAGAADARHAGADGSAVAPVPACSAEAEVPAVDGGGADGKAGGRVSHVAPGGMGGVRKDANSAGVGSVGASGEHSALHAGTSTAGGSRGQLGEEQQPAQVQQAPAVGRGEAAAEATVRAVTATASVPTSGGEEKRGGADGQGGLSDGEDEDLPDIVLASPDDSDDSE